MRRELSFSFLHLLKMYLDETNSCKSNKRHYNDDLLFPKKIKVWVR